MRARLTLGYGPTASSATLHGAFVFAKEPVTLEVEPWPAARDCDTCVSIQFGTLELRLPLADVGKLLVLSAGSHPALHMLPKSGEVTEGLMLLVMPSDKIIKQRGVVEGSDTAYLLSGVITQAVYETLLANARVTKIP